MTALSLQQTMTLSSEMEAPNSERVDVVSMSEDESEVGSDDVSSEVSASEPTSENQESGSPDNKSKRYYCDTCSASFTMIGNLNRHKKSHLHHRPYTCNFCLRGFLRRTSYVEHVRLHTGEKPYKCKYCTQSFVRKKCHQMHIRKCALGIPDTSGSPQASTTQEDSLEPTLVETQKEERRQKQSMAPVRESVWNNPGLPFNPLMTSRPPPPPFARSASMESSSSQTSTEINSAIFQHLRNPSLTYAGLLNKSLFSKPHLPFLPGLLPPFPNRSAFGFDFPAGRKMLSPPVMLPTLKRESQRTEQSDEMADRFISLNAVQKDRKLWQCKFCDIYFTDHYLYLSHVSMHGEENPLTCNLCKKACKTVQEFLMHH